MSVYVMMLFISVCLCKSECIQQVLDRSIVSPHSPKHEPSHPYGQLIWNCQIQKSKCQSGSDNRIETFGENFKATIFTSNDLLVWPLKWLSKCLTTIQSMVKKLLLKPAWVPSLSPHSWRTNHDIFFPIKNILHWY